MRVTFLIRDLGYAGGNRVVAIYSERLRRRGHEVTVVAGAPFRVSLFDKLKSKLRGRGWPQQIGSAQPYFEDLGVPVSVLSSNRQILDDDVPDGDVIVATWWETAEWVNALSSRKGAKAYFVQHHEVFSYLPVERSSATYRLPLAKIVISRWLEQAMAALYGDDSSVLVLNSVDTDQFFAPPRRKQLDPTVGFLYSTVNFKAPDIMLSVLHEMKKKLPGMKAVAFGSEMVAKEFSLPDWIEFHYRPPQQDIRLIYSKCDVWVCASRSEGFHLPPLEAMACRCPVVSTSVGGPMDIIENGVNGFLVDVDDAASLARRTLEVLALTDYEWNVMSAAAEATAHRYSWDDAADLLESALLKIVERSTVGPLGRSTTTAVRSSEANAL
jgi:glycosyltransferase involved in cell wall biosynthesis